MVDQAVLEYTPDEDIRVHEEGAIRLLCRAFQSHENGLPEWFKNSSDAYAGIDAGPDQRVIVLILSHGRGRQTSISCLDFVGMTSADIEGRFRIWADPEAAIRNGGAAAEVQGGHGNGGKCYMTQMFEDHAQLFTVRDGRANRYGVNAGSVRFGYVPHRERGRDFEVTDVDRQLDELLRALGCTLDALPDAAHRALDLSRGFTLVTGQRPRGFDTGRIPVRRLTEQLQDHPQMIVTLELCHVFMLVNGAPFNADGRLELPAIPPMTGVEEPRVITIPDTLVDASSGEEVSTTNSDAVAPGSLSLRSSNVSMRYSRRGRHTVVYKAESDYIGYIPVPELDVQSAYRDRIYGECTLTVLEPYKQNERARLADAPLTRAVNQFISRQVLAYARVFEERDRRQYNQQERTALERMNDALDRWKNRFLNQMMRGMWGPGTVTAPPPPPPLPVGAPARLELALTHSRAGIGVPLRPTLKFFDPDARRIRAVPFHFVSDDNNFAMVDDDLQVVNTFSPGNVRIHAETLDGRLRSNEVELEVARIEEVRIDPQELELPVGTRHRLEAVCQLPGGEEAKNVSLVWDENHPDIARVSTSGQVFGFAEGETQVYAGDDHCLSRDPAVVRVVAGDGRGPGETGRGRGYPRILISGVNQDPETDEDVNFTADDPPVAQRPEDYDRNIWWINSSAPLAKMFLDSHEYGYDSREWRMYHLERYTDVLVQIALTHGPEEQEAVSINDWILQWGFKAAEIQGAAAASLRQFIENGELPGE